MTKEIYKSPQSNIVEENKVVGEFPSPLIIGLWLTLASLLMGVVLVLIEFFVGKELPGANAVTTVLPAMLVGYFYGQKFGVLFPSRLRHLSIAVWFILNAIVVGAYFAVFFEGFSQSGIFKMLKTPMFIGIMVVVFILIYFVSYFVFKQGEKSGVKQRQKK
ncbi:ABZJ_00895 family protein [Pleionea sediminis]|uniref:ABZJ_00895 family protein n=1 Tax=Pleionea sediminis TaxID=2569479 RepID=UPI001185B5CC|nr:ABZJ_00895 family protein [Pleionea sediminis]